MSTRANLKVIDTWKDAQGKRQEDTHPVILYHHSDGYPDWMGPHLEDMLNRCRDLLIRSGVPYWWDSCRVAALFVGLSLTERAETVDLQQFEDWKRTCLGLLTVPAWQPTGALHGDIEYLWEVRLDCGEPIDRRTVTPADLKATITCYEVIYDWDKKDENDEPARSFKRVNWQAVVRRSQQREARA